MSSRSVTTKSPPHLVDPLEVQELLHVHGARGYLTVRRRSRDDVDRSALDDVVGERYRRDVIRLLPFNWHPVVIVVIIAAGVAHHLLVTSRHQRRLARYALLALLVVTVWPIGDLAASVSLSVATAQRLVIMLLVAPLLLLSVPTEVLGRVDAPRARRLSRAQARRAGRGARRRHGGWHGDADRAGRRLRGALSSRDATSSSSRSSSLASSSGSPASR